MTQSDFSILADACTVKFRIQAFNEYCMARRENYQKIANMLSQSILDLPDEEGVTSNPAVMANKSSTTNVAPDVEDEYAEQLCITNGFSPDSVVLLQTGYTTLKTLIKQARASVRPSLNQEDALEDAAITVSNAAGDSLNPLTYSEAANEIAAGLHSATAIIAGNKAAMEPTVSGGLIVFRDELSSLYANSYSDISNTAAMVKSIIETSRGDAGAYLQSLKNAMNVDVMAEANSTAVPANDRFYTFTGSSPTGCFASNIDGVGKAVASVANAGAKILGGILNGVLNVGKMLFNKAKSFVTETLIDPKDIKYDASGESPTADGFSCDSPDVGILVSDVEFLDSGLTLQTVANLITPYYNQWLSYDTVFGSLLFRIQSSVVNAELGSMTVTYSSKFKPKSINPVVVDQLMTAGILAHDSTQEGVQYYTVSDLEGFRKFLSDCVATGVDYTDANSDEKTVYSGFMLGHCLFNFLCNYGWKNYNGSYNTDLTGRRVTRLDPNFVGQIRNCDFITVLSGFYWSGQAINWVAGSVLNRSGSNPTIISTGVWPAGQEQLIHAFICHLIDRFERPVDFQFFPFCNGSWNFPQGKWTVPSDQDNNNAFTKFVAAAIAVVLVAAVAFTAVKVIKTIKNKATKKALERKSRLDNAMWNGKPLSKKEWKQYKRANKKLNKSSILSAGLQETPGVSNDDSQLNEDLAFNVTAIQKLITPEDIAE